VDAGNTKVLNKSEVYQRAFKLMLHQSDAAKFVSRDGQSDREMIQHIEALKGTEARKFFEVIAWQGHSMRTRSMTMEMYKEISDNEGIFESFSLLLTQGRIPVFQKLDAKGEPKYQMAHLSFQEMLAGEFCACILRFSSSQSQVREYGNFVLSESSKTLGRDRLADNWWLSVWLGVGSLLDPEQYSNWCNILADDDRTRLRPGRITWFWRDNVIFGLQKRIEGFSKEEAELRAEYYLLKVIYVDPENQLVQLKPHFSWIDKTILALQHMHFPRYCCAPVCAAACFWGLEGLNKLCIEGTRLGQGQLVKDLTARDVHYCLSAKSLLYQMVFFSAIEETSWNVAEYLAEKQVDLDFGNASEKYRVTSLHKRYVQPRSTQVQRPFAAPIQLGKIKHKLTGVLHDAFEGNLKITDEVDPNYLEPRTGISLLMLACARSHVELAADLLRKRAMVNAKTSDGCTALAFALDCTYDDDRAIECAKLLLDARADVNAKSGTSVYGGTWLQGYLGTNQPMGACALFAKEERKLDLLTTYGYDLRTSKDDIGHNAAFMAALCSDESEGHIRIFNRAKETGLTLMDPTVENRQDFENEHPGFSSASRDFTRKTFKDQRACLTSIFAPTFIIEECLAAGADANDQFDPDPTFAPECPFAFPWGVVTLKANVQMNSGDMSAYLAFWKSGLKIDFVFLKLPGLKMHFVAFFAFSSNWSTTTWQKIFTLYAERFEYPLPKGCPLFDDCFKWCSKRSGKIWQQLPFYMAYIDWMEARREKYKQQQLAATS